jgi:hypothetical protein
MGSLLVFGIRFSYRCSGSDEWFIPVYNYNNTNGKAE